MSSEEIEVDFKILQHKENEISDLKPTYSERRVSMNKRSIENKENDEKVEVKQLSKDEKKIWSKTCRKMLESIIFKSVLVDLESTCNKTSSICKSTTNLMSQKSLWDETNRNEIRIDIVKYLFNDDLSLLRIISGSNIHHNCTKLNKHGVVVVEKKGQRFNFNFGGF